MRHLDEGTTICVFAKPPVPGRAKTRLGREIGHARAARFAAALLADTVARARTTGARVVLATTDMHAAFPGVDPEVARVDQGRGDLGERLERVLAAASSAGPALALGADSPGFPLGAVHRAVDACRAGRAAIGRTGDGGFYLLAVPRLPSGALRDLPWSAPGTAAATAARLAEIGLAPIDVAPWFDVDVAADLHRFRATVPRADAPATWRLLDDGPG